MISGAKFDTDSARLMLSYLGRALKHYDERQFAKQKVRIELARLKKISTKSMKKYVQDLERSIGEAIRREQSILKHQQQEEFLHTDINERVKELEEKLANYLAIHESRARKVKLLESALATELEKKEDQLKIIKRSLESAEKIHKELSKSKKHPKKQLDAVRKTLERIRKKVRAAEKKL
ncbi:MAG: hypothetical protein QXM31_03745 [Candidatus Woesearchaeota archaeon]